MRHGLFARRLFATSIRSVALATATLAGLAMVGSSVIAPASFGDETAGGTQATVPDLFAKSQSSNGLTVSIDQLSPKILTNESELVVSGTITNTGDEALSAPLLMVSMAFSPADSIRELADSLDASTRPGRLISYEETSEDIPGGQTIPFEVHIPVDRLDLYSSYDWGPRALGVDVLFGGSQWRGSYDFYLGFRPGGPADAGERCCSVDRVEFKQYRERAFGDN